MSAARTQSPEELWLQYVARLLWKIGNLDVASYDAFLRAASLGVPASIAIEQIAARIRAAGDRPRRNKLESQWRRAQTHVKAEPNSRGPIVPIQRPAFNPDRAKQIADRLPASVDLQWLKRRSPVPTWITPAEYLSAIFPHGDQVLVFSNYRSQGEALYQNWSLKVDRDALKSFVSGHQDVWFLSNPVDGQYHFNPRQDSMSRRSEESITAWRYAVLECDHEPKETWLPIWLRILVQLPLPIVSITYSGDKSLHALLRVDAESKSGWDQFVRGRLLPRLVPLGADPGALKAVQLTRLPGCYRGDSLQELLYLNLRATSQPIFQK
jgi:hypothetical protein